MRQETFNQLKKASEILAAFGESNSTTQIKKYAKLTCVINKIESVNQESVINQVLAFYRGIFAEIPKDIRGIAKREFCNSIRKVFAQNGTLFVFDNNGNICAPRAVAKLKKSDNVELFQLLGNLFANSEAVENNIEAIEAKEAKEAKELISDISKAA